MFAIKEDNIGKALVKQRKAKYKEYYQRTLELIFTDKNKFYSYKLIYDVKDHLDKHGFYRHDFPDGAFVCIKSTVVSENNETKHDRYEVTVSRRKQFTIKETEEKISLVKETNKIVFKNEPYSALLKKSPNDQAEREAVIETIDHITWLRIDYL